jgi:DNA topoisomerase-1
MPPKGEKESKESKIIKEKKEKTEKTEKAEKKEKKITKKEGDTTEVPPEQEVVEKKPRKKTKTEESKMIQEDVPEKIEDSTDKKVKKNAKKQVEKKITTPDKSDRVYSGKQVIIVESPNKIKKINEILQKIKKHPNFENCQFVVTASCGHIREIDKKHVGISLETFEPHYQISDSKINIVSDLKSDIKGASLVILAADADREGEAIAWHVMDVLKLKEEDYNRITFNEITEKAILEALLHPRKVDMNMYYSQKARSVIDKLIGYLISPVLDSQFQTFGLSCGRVQSPALKLVYEREKEIEKFESSGYYQTNGVFNPVKKEIKSLTFHADLDKTFENKDATIKFMDLANLAEYKIIDISVSKTKRRPPPPFITSSIQQEASIKMGLSPDNTMKMLQKLFESGHITYHRTDSLILSEDSKKEIQKVVGDSFGDEYYQNNFYANKDDAQAAHEPIRPTHMDQKSLPELSSTENRLYQMIYNRTVASQMSHASVDIKTVKIGMDNSDRIFLVKAEQITSKGFLVLYEHYNESRIKTKKGKGKGKGDEEGDEDDKDDDDGEDNDDEMIDNSELFELLNQLSIGDLLKYKTIQSVEKFSKPIPRYTEASLIKELEKRGLGRPSTYATLITKILDPKKNYAKILSKNSEKKDSFILEYKNTSDGKGKFSEKTIKVNMGGYKNKMVCLETGKSVIEFLNKNFDKIMDYNYTSSMEKKLDDICSAKYIWQDIVKENYNSFAPQIEIVRNKQADGDKGKVKKYLGSDPKTNSDIVILYNKNGPTIYTETPEGEKKYCNITDEEANVMNIERALELLKYPLLLKSPSGKDEDNIEICKGKTNYYLKQNKSSIPLTDTAENEPTPLTWAIANEMFKHNQESMQSRIIKTFEEDPKLHIVNARYGPCIEYNGKKSKVFVSIPKGKNIDDLTFEVCAELVNKKKEALKKGIKTKPFRKFGKKKE